MKTSRFIAPCLMAMMVVAPISRAGASDLGAALAGAVIGGVIVDQAHKNKQTRTRTVYRNTTSSYTRAQNREIQTSLNYFSFPAGVADGALGRRSRAAISQYQAYMGFPATGYLTPYERDFLVTSYHRSIAGGAATSQLIAQNQQGTRGLLIAYRNQQAGVAAPVPAAPLVQPAPATTAVAAPAPAPTPVMPLVEASGDAALPNFLGQSESLSLASHCNTISLLTNTNGGFVTEASMSDPNQALNEQFCLARTYAIAQGEELAAKVQGFTSEQIAKQCAGFGPVLKEHVAALSLKPQQEVLQDVGGFVLQSGMSPAQLSGTSKICLSVGYRTDDMDVAIGSALLLVALGNPVYGELMGHHLSQGIGASQNPTLALSWYQTGLDALASGATPVFAPGQPDRTSLIQKAAFAYGGQSGVAPQDAALPVFNVQQ